MSAPAYADSTVTLYYGTAETLLPTLPDASVQLLLCDPPYMGVKADAWDNQWPTREAYLAWLRQLAKEWQRILTPNGSLYCFASPQMAAHVEVLLGEVFTVLNHIVWRKDEGKHKQAEKESLHTYFPQSERILFCEQRYEVRMLKGESCFWEADQAVILSLFTHPIANAMRRTMTTVKEVTEAIGAYGNINHGGAVSNWLRGYNIPTKAQYEAMRVFFNSRAPKLGDSYLYQDYQYLYEEYETLRRPFTVSAHVPYTDVWDFTTVQATSGKHPCEKPLPLLRHIIECSSRPGDLVLDPMCGSGSTLDAARQCGRKAIGIEQDAGWVRHASRRLAQQCLF